VTATTPDPVATNNSGSAATALDAPATNLSVTRTCLPTGPVAPGDTLTCTVNFTNNGPRTASNVVLSSTLKNGLAFVSLTAPAGWNCATPPVGAGGDVSCANPAVPPGTTVLTVVVRVTPDATGTVGAHIAIGSSTPNLSITTGPELPRPVLASANLRIAKTGPTKASVGAQVVYEITVVNAGPADAQAVVLSDPTPPGLSLVSVTAPCGGGFPCVLGTLAAGAIVHIHATYTVETTAVRAFPLHNEATVTSSTLDPDPDNTAVFDTEIPLRRIPTLSTWAFLVLGLLLAGLGLRRIGLARLPRA
jgi:large repetitive protein